MPPSPPLAAITGASSGIGAEFARQLARRGYRLLLIARRLDRMEQLAATLPVSCECMAADLAVAADRHRVAGRLASASDLALLVNNAGFGTRRRFWEADLDGQQRMHEVHVLATMELTHAALQTLTRQGRGGIINVASVAGFVRSPASVSYCATKAWMVAFTEGLSLELRDAAPGVTVQALCPGFTYSEFHDVMGAERTQMAAHNLWLKAEDVVRGSIEGLDRRKLFVIPGWRYRFFCAVFPKLPLAVRLWMQARSPHSRYRM